MDITTLAQSIQADIVGPDDLTITGINTIKDATQSEACFLSSAKHAPQLEDSQAGAVIVQQALSDIEKTQLVVDDVNRGLIEALKLFAPPLTGFKGIHPTAVVEDSATLHETVAVGPNAYIGPDVKIEANTVIGPGCSIGERSTIGLGCRLDSNVVVYHDCQIGNACIIHANSTIGATGFGYSYYNNQHNLVPHNGGVILEDGVEIGSNSCVDRAKFGNTLIGAGTKIDNFVQIAHNVKTGKLCLFAGHVGISGSTTIGNGVIFGGASGTADNLSVGDGCIFGAQAVASKDIEAGKKLLGTPAQDMADEMRCLAAHRNLPNLVKEVKQLKRRIAELEKS